MTAVDSERIQRSTERDRRSEPMSREQIAELVAEAIRRGELRLAAGDRSVRIA
jgi:hypothetical protein